jgi:hypothetical protein
MLSAEMGQLESIGVHFASYNFVRVHHSLRVTPALQGGIADRVWTIGGF